MPRGIVLSDLRARIDPVGVLARRVRLAVEAVRLTLDEEALRRALPSDGRIALERIGDERVWLRFETGFFGGMVELRPRVAANGRLAVDILSARAGFFPIPGAIAGALLPFVREKFAGKPGLYVGERGLEIDLRDLVRDQGVDLPPLQSALVRRGLLELIYSQPPR